MTSTFTTISKDHTQILNSYKFQKCLEITIRKWLKTSPCTDMLFGGDYLTAIISSCNILSNSFTG